LPLLHWLLSATPAAAITTAAAIVSSAMFASALFSPYSPSHSNSLCESLFARYLF